MNEPENPKRKVFANVFGDTLYEDPDDPDNGNYEELAKFYWPPDEFARELLDLATESDDPGEKNDLAEAAEQCTELARILIGLAREGDSRTALILKEGAKLGYFCGVFLARYEARSRRRHHAAGGKATKALTPEQEKLALEIIDQKRIGLGKRWKRAACIRAAAELQASHEIAVSKDTLLRLIRSQK